MSRAEVVELEQAKLNKEKALMNLEDALEKPKENADAAQARIDRLLRNREVKDLSKDEKAKFEKAINAGMGF